ncbi:probable NAD(P)H dehydrogenase subunit CRR3, chloroplastic [Herrania umbratica]|uniref:Probable NAD(P)H dehydrogenase subunit CRR3, chloroplastic n=1 Tax=Herrania umbratica TaxID=108875 RepID=A0A6J1B3N6_9ROSI|nr:probable NAD(P)H dehydrogenase subunit CRR3, chloroplastic [Herrania umbratica]
MACLSCTSISVPKAVAHPFASLTNNPSPPQEVKSNPKPRTTTRPRKRRQRLHQQKPQPPSIIQIERAIGAGSFRDADSSDLEHRRRTVFDGLLPITGGKFEGEIERKLRETGEWIGSRTEATFRSSGKRILLVVLQWFLPIWTFSLLVASGVIKLPFSTPLIDDLIM